MPHLHRVPPVRGPLDAVVEVPGSKSITNRALVCAALADGESTVVGLAPGDDTISMLSGLAALGIDIRVAAEHTATVRGMPPAGWVRDDVILQTGLAGTTSRFLTALVALGDRPVVIDGEEPLRRRPMGPLHRSLEQLGATLTGERDGYLPVRVKGPLRGAVVALPGDVSSQFITALMLVGPLLPAGLSIELTTPLVSRPYVAMTAAVMEAFGAPEIEIGPDRVTIAAGRYRATRYDVEPDASSASYPLAAAALCGGRVLVPRLGPGSLQGDADFAALLGRMGAQVSCDDQGTEVRMGEGALQGLGVVDLADMSDLVPTLMVTAAFANGPTRVTGVGFIRHKESDRIGDLAVELRSAGAVVAEHDDGLEVTASNQPERLRATTFGTHHDHRLAMALALVGLRLPGVAIADPEVVSKSWPGYWRALDVLAG